jgi:hypothetical protein
MTVSTIDNPIPSGTLNTDRNLWRDDGTRLFITETGGIGMEVAGRVIVKSLRDWHSLALKEHDAIEALDDVHSWAEQRCPCANEQPDPCPLCGEPVDGGACRAVDKTFPFDLGARIIAILQRAKEKRG